MDYGFYPTRETIICHSPPVRPVACLVLIHCPTFHSPAQIIFPLEHDLSIVLDQDFNKVDIYCVFDVCVFCQVGFHIQGIWSVAFDDRKT